MQNKKDSRISLGAQAANLLSEDKFEADFYLCRYRVKVSENFGATQVVPHGKNKFIKKWRGQNTNL